ncbi:SHOCT domain-containing protein [uncultured Acidaminococcus sp.]|uniref:SHOCT domain-containing protein n=1 Tax=uncultured Acidaminococcus sp. TaxID=352152 RepID=UPI00259A59B4|nr:SHOCT domain-containing protein [uncultured Acidaminococcus sp.]
MIVIYREGGVPMVTNESFQREINYAVAKSLLKRMKKQGLITAEELEQADRKLRAKYAPLVFALVA